MSLDGIIFPTLVCKQITCEPLRWKAAKLGGSGRASSISPKSISILVCNTQKNVTIWRSANFEGQIQGQVHKLQYLFRQ